MNLQPLDQRPIVVAVAGPNGAGKTTFYHAHLAETGLRFINADVLAAELGLAPYEAAGVADAVRRELLNQGESFIFETVFSDPAGDKVAFLEGVVRKGYTVVVCYVGLADSDQSVERVAMRALQGGHTVPHDKLRARFPRTLNNLKRAVACLPHVLVFDNSDLSQPYRLAAVIDHGRTIFVQQPLPEWIRPLVP